MRPRERRENERALPFYPSQGNQQATYSNSKNTGGRKMKKHFEGNTIATRYFRAAKSIKVSAGWAV